MDLFLDLLVKLFPLYLIILLGYLAGRYLEVDKQSIATFLFYTVVPVVNFKAVFEADLSPIKLTYPLYLFIAGVILSTSFFTIGRNVFKKVEDASLLSLTSTLANTGYFGIPLLIVLYGEDILSSVILIIFGLALHESSVGFYLAAQGKYSAKEAFKRTVKVPIIYAVVLAVISNLVYNNIFLNIEASAFKSGIEDIVSSLLHMMEYFVGALTVLGMGMIGLGLASIKKFKFDWRFIGLSLFSKYLIYPSIFVVFYFINQSLNIYDQDFIKIVFYISLVPVGANSITLASQLKLNTDNASFVVVLSTFLSLILIPLATMFNFSFL